MTSLPTIQKLSKLGKVLSNLAFIFSIVGCVGCLLGMIVLQSGAGSVLKLGGVTIHGLVGAVSGIGNRGITAGLCGWLVVCVGQGGAGKVRGALFPSRAGCRNAIHRVRGKGAAAAGDHDHRNFPGLRHRREHRHGDRRGVPASERDELGKS